ncbi:MAG: hypothetical protein EBV03_13225, partial [Proteobacteria bacterium]|nr:hypothetical protein [Pseudomonadota bacterium]
ILLQIICSYNFCPFCFVEMFQTNKIIFFYIWHCKEVNIMEIFRYGKFGSSNIFLQKLQEINDFF